MNLRDCALGAVIAASLFVGGQAAAKPAVAAPTLVGAALGEPTSTEAALGFAAMRFCLGRVLDIAGAITALAKQI